MIACLYRHAPVSGAELQNWLETHPELYWVYLEGEPDIALSYTVDLIQGKITSPYRADLPNRIRLPLGLSSWTHGRAFGALAELRWTLRLDGKFDIALLTETSAQAEGWEADSTRFDPPTAQDRRRAMLWGTRTDGQQRCWIETRIPRPLHYPVSFADYHDQQLYLFCQDYRIESVIRLTRLIGIGGENDGNHR